MRAFMGRAIARVPHLLSRSSTETLAREERKRKGPRIITSAKTGTTVVLVHAAWADSSSWNKVTEELQRKGFEVVAAQIPLTSFADDVTVLKKVLLREKGPIVLVGHSYGGAVVTAALPEPVGSISPSRRGQDRSGWTSIENPKSGPPCWASELQVGDGKI